MRNKPVAEQTLFDSSAYIDLTANAFSDGRIKRSASRALIKAGKKWCPKCRRVLDLSDFQILPSQRRGYCQECAKFAARQFANKKYYKIIKGTHKARKMELVKLLGGRCVRCGYNESASALDFHHIVCQTKKYTVAMKLGATTHTTINHPELLREVDKCAILCSNCHRSIREWGNDVEWEKLDIGWGIKYE